MRTCRLPAYFVAAVLAILPACRNTGPRDEHATSSPSSSAAYAQSAETARGGSSGTVETSTDAGTIETKPAVSSAPAARSDAPAAGTQQGGISAPDARPPTSAKNRDKLGPPDVGQYIDKLQSASRVAELRVDVVLEKLALPDDALVGDLGCGPGVFTLAFARACPDGIVFASDIEPAQLDVVRQRIRETNRRNIVPVLASEDDAHFPPGLLDVVFIADTYHHLENRVTYMRRVGKALKPGGRLVVIDYKPGHLPIGPPPEHKLAAGVMDKELIDAGWKLVERFDTHPYHDFEVWRLVQPWEK